MGDGSEKRGICIRAIRKEKRWRTTGHETGYKTRQAGETQMQEPEAMHARPASVMKLAGYGACW